MHTESKHARTCLAHAVLPDGLDDPDSMRLVRTRYLDFTGQQPWLAVREFA